MSILKQRGYGADVGERGEREIVRRNIDNAISVYGSQEPHHLKYGGLSNALRPYEIDSGIFEIQSAVDVSLLVDVIGGEL
jgi:hypothetical protein